MKERLEKLKGIKKTMDSEVSRGIPVSAVASIFGINDDSVWRILKHYVDSAREKIDPSDIVASIIP